MIDVGLNDKNLCLYIENYVVSMYDYCVCSRYITLFHSRLNKILSVCNCITFQCNNSLQFTFQPIYLSFPRNVNNPRSFFSSLFFHPVIAINISPSKFSPSSTLFIAIFVQSSSHRPLSSPTFSVPFWHVLIKEVRVQPAASYLSSSKPTRPI